MRDNNKHTENFKRSVISTVYMHNETARTFIRSPNLKQHLCYSKNALKK